MQQQVFVTSQSHHWAACVCVCVCVCGHMYDKKYVQNMCYKTVSWPTGLIIPINPEVSHRWATGSSLRSGCRRRDDNTAPMMGCTFLCFWVRGLSFLWCCVSSVEQRPENVVFRRLDEWMEDMRTRVCVCVCVWESWRGTTNESKRYVEWFMDSWRQYYRFPSAETHQILMWWRSFSCKTTYCNAALLMGKKSL